MAGTTVATGKQGPSKVFFRCDGFDLILQKLAGLTHKIGDVAEQIDGLGDTTEVFSPIGKSHIELAQSGGYYDSAANGPHIALATSRPFAVSGTPRIVCVGFAGDAIGQSFYGHEGEFAMAYEVIADLKGLQKANATWQETGQFDKGVILQNSVAKTADWDTNALSTYIDYTLDPTQRILGIASVTKANPCVVTTAVPHGLANGQKVFIAGNSLSANAINGEQTATVISATTFSVAVDTSGSTGTGSDGTVVQANTVNGAVGYQQIAACSGFTNFVGTIRASDDDITYSDLIVFDDNVVAPYAQRLTVAGTIPRYLAYKGDVTGSGSITAWAGLARS